MFYNKIRITLSFIILVYVSANISADGSFGGFYSDYLYYQRLLGAVENPSLNFHTYSDDLLSNKNQCGFWDENLYTSTAIDRESITLSVIPIENYTSYNSSKAFGMNDGAFWQGKGVNTRIIGGFLLQNDWLQLTVLPEIWASQNADFEIIATPYSSGFGDYWVESIWEGFDNLQRYGSDFIYQFNWGQTGIRIDWRDFLTLGFSNENIIIGPARQNNILLGENSSGFPHFDFGTDGRVPFLNWGDIDVRVVWGWLHESDFADEGASNDYGWFSGMYTAWSPSFYPDITVGLNHQYYSPWSEWDALDLVKFIPWKFEKNSGSDPNDAMISVSFDWVFPDIGLNIYADWGRNDNVGSIEGTIVSPEHTQGITVGLAQELYSGTDAILILSAESSNLEQERTFLERAAGPWYRHGWSGWTQGYTNEGQLMGAAIGPGSNSQWVQLTWLHPKGMVNFFSQRIAHDKDYYYNLVLDEVTDIGAYVEVLTGIDMLYFYRDFDIYGNVTYSFSYNFNFVENNDISNIYLAMGVRYRY